MTQHSNSDDPMFNVPPATMYMVAAIFIVHLLMMVTTQATENWVLLNFSFRPAVVTAILDNPTVPNLFHLFVTLNSHMFLHHDWAHMVINAGMLLAFGTMVERHFGPTRFLVLYFLSGWSGAIAEYLIAEPGLDIFLYGASGGVFGAMGATAIVLLPRYKWRGVLIFVAVLMGINLLVGATDLGTLLVGPGAGIAWAAHCGGFAAGMLLAFLYTRIGKNTRI
ncbi:MAG: rhomboid family intramembrane serine protease [Sneathiella sp.]